jgi:hypothetical protein
MLPRYTADQSTVHRSLFPAAVAGALCLATLLDSDSPSAPVVQTHQSAVDKAPAQRRRRA